MKTQHLECLFDAVLENNNITVFKNKIHEHWVLPNTGFCRMIATVITTEIQPQFGFSLKAAHWLAVSPT